MLLCCAVLQLGQIGAWRSKLWSAGSSARDAAVHAAAGAKEQTQQTAKWLQHALVCP